MPAHPHHPRWLHLVHHLRPTGRPAVKLSETCRCGASVEVEDDQRADVLAAIATWRTTHPCLPPGQPSRVDPQAGGSTCGVIGFAARNPWDGPPAWTGHNGPQA
jgi:hypothetical protein